MLNRYGVKISQLALLSEKEILHRLNCIDDEECQFQIAIHRLLFSMYTMDSLSFERVLDYCFLNWPTHKITCYVIDPFLKITGLLWQGHRLPEEHLVVTILRKKLHYAIEQLLLSVKVGKSALLFLSDSRQLDLSLLYASYLLKESGVQVIYMGNDVSIDNLSVIFDTLQPDFLYTYFPERNNFYFEKLISIMNKKLPKAKLYVTLQTGTLTSSGKFSDKVCITNFEKAIKMMCEE